MSQSLDLTHDAHSPRRGSQGIGPDLLQSSSLPQGGTNAVSSVGSTDFAQEEEELARLMIQWQKKKLELDAKRVHLESENQVLAQGAEGGEITQAAGTIVETTIPLEDRRKDEAGSNSELKVREKEPSNVDAPLSREYQNHFRHILRLELSRTTGASTRTTPDVTSETNEETAIWKRVAWKEVCSRCKQRGESCYRHIKFTGQYSACRGCAEAKAKCSTVTDDASDSRGGRPASPSMAARKKRTLPVGNDLGDVDRRRSKRARRETVKDVERALFTPPSPQVTNTGLNRQRRDEEILQGIERLLHEQLNTRKVLEDLRYMLESGGSIHPQLLPIDYENSSGLDAEIEYTE